MTNKWEMQGLYLVLGKKFLKQWYKNGKISCIIDIIRYSAIRYSLFGIK